MAKKSSTPIETKMLKDKARIEKFINKEITRFNKVYPKHGVGTIGIEWNLIRRRYEIRLMFKFDKSINFPNC